MVVTDFLDQQDEGVVVNYNSHKNEIGKIIQISRLYRNIKIRRKKMTDYYNL